MMPSTQGYLPAGLVSVGIQQLLRRFQRINVKCGEKVISQGETGDYYYLIERGRCRVTREICCAKVELDDLCEGDSFGEEALLPDAARNATVSMKTDGVLLRLDKTCLIGLLNEAFLQRLTPRAALERVAAGARWLDVRYPVEYRHDGLADALNIPVSEIRHTVSGLDPAQVYVVYSQNGRRSSAAAFLLGQRGIQAYLLDGGLEALRTANSGGHECPRLPV